MIITWNGDENFTVKTKHLMAKIGAKNQLGDLEIKSPGEYEVAGVQIEITDGIIQLFAEGMTIGHIKKGKVMTDEELEKLNDFDILLIGAGGGEFSETKTALEMINQIEPSVVIPMGSGDLGDFIKQEGASSEAKDEFKINRAELTPDDRSIIILNAH